MITITTIRGREINIEIVGMNVVASAGGLEFIVELTPTGIKSRFPVGGQKMEAGLDEKNHAAAKAMFDFLVEGAQEHVAAESAYYDHTQKIINAMN